MTSSAPLGATLLEEGRCCFTVWAPLVKTVEVHLTAPSQRTVPMERLQGGYFQAELGGVGAGSRYFFRLDGRKDRPDPASRFQPEGVHGPSQVVDTGFPWEDGGWSGLSLRDAVMYELHVGTYTAEGTFDGVIPHLDGLAEMGINAVEIMPVAQFPGGRNWGYDGVFPFAVQNTYGGPVGFKRLVNGCHQRGMAVILDVVYNHLGPEGNYLRDFGPYFTDRYRTPWGAALNFDGPHSDDVRRFFLENALCWAHEFHVDGLRLDAVHAIKDFSATPFLEELATVVREGARPGPRKFHLIAESDLNDPRLVRDSDQGGYGLDAQWNDDFHHALHALLTGERTGYYEDFGRLADLAKAFREGFVYDGRYSSYRSRRHGRSARGIPAHRLVVFAQNHDQVGNRMLGQRLSELLPFESLKLGAGVVVLSPFIPLLFMGEEYGETAPFQYFISHLDPGLVEAVRKGRREEFAAFGWKEEPPDPQAEETFRRATLKHPRMGEGHPQVLRHFYRELIRLRRQTPSLSRLSVDSMEVVGLEEEKILAVHRWSEQEETLALFHFGDEPFAGKPPVAQGMWAKLLDSAEERWLGPGSPLPSRVEGPGQLFLPSKGFVLLGKERKTSHE